MKRCAIYTRKSSDEGFDQKFNSLDAQRESCEAFVMSQAGQGWSALRARYDDGGFSGGSMERPALQRLLGDIARGLVDVVVVYKIDRLTRSLADFARIVERFDAKEVSFVSVTQAFNTTSSMGRLTLNVLLSFAQFEREVTGERIRDKIAASKAKGMWMGGNLPFGYDLPTGGTRALQVNEDEASTVRHVFNRYLELGSVHRLLQEVGQDGLRSRAGVDAAGEVTSFRPFKRGAMFHMLQNRVYVGMIVHKGRWFPGQHESIVEASKFEQVQAKLRRQMAERKTRKRASSPFAGKLLDMHGNHLSPTHSKNPKGKTYRYYVPRTLQQGGRAGNELTRYPAARVEALLTAALQRIAVTSENGLHQLVRARLSPNGVEIVLLNRMLPAVRAALADGESVTVDDDMEHIRWCIPALLKPRGGRAKVHLVSADAPYRDQVLIEGLQAAHRMVDWDRFGHPSAAAMPKSRYAARLMRLALLSPRIQRDILAGRQPVNLRLKDLVTTTVPLCWEAQDRMIEDLRPARGRR